MYIFNFNSMTGPGGTPLRCGGEEETIIYMPGKFTYIHVPTIFIQCVYLVDFYGNIRELTQKMDIEDISLR